MVHGAGGRSFLSGAQCWGEEFLKWCTVLGGGVS